MHCAVTGTPFMTRLIGAVLVVLGALAVAAPLRAADYVEKQTGVAFPDTIGKFMREGVHELPDRRLGVAIRYYVRKLAKADIFVYDLGMAGIGTGVASPLVRSQFEQMQRDVFRIQDRGDYVGVTLLGETGANELPRVGALSLLHARFSYAEKSAAGTVGPKLMSHAYITGFRGALFKLRITYPAALEDQGQKLTAEFLEGLRSVLEP